MRIKASGVRFGEDDDDEDEDDPPTPTPTPPSFLTNAVMAFSLRGEFNNKSRRAALSVESRERNVASCDGVVFGPFWPWFWPSIILIAS